MVFVFLLMPIKLEIKKAIEDMYNVTVVDVNTINYSGKKKSRYTKSGIINGKQSAFKKAIVTLKEGETIVSLVISKKSNGNTVIKAHKHRGRDTKLLVHLIKSLQVHRKVSL